MIDQEVIRSFSSLSLKWWWKCWGKIYEIESQLKLGQYTLLTCWPFSNVGLSNVEGAPFHVPHIYFHLHWLLDKLHEVWSQEVTWNDKLWPCLNCFIKWIGIWDVDQTLRPCSNSSNSTHEQKLWWVRVELMLGKCLNWLTTQILGFNEVLLWPRWNYDFGTRYEVEP